MTMKIKSATPRLYRMALGILILGLFSGAPIRLYATGVPSPCLDFVTGGGWFSPRCTVIAGNPDACPDPAPDRVNFGFNAGYRTEGGELKGEFNLIDHNTGMHLEGRTVDFYVAESCGTSDGACADRIFRGDAEIDGVAGYRYQVEVFDAGEPGNAPKGQDRILVGATNGYFADSGGLGRKVGASTGIDGGNIQLHKPCTGVSPK